MRLKKFSIKNFRGYGSETSFDFSNLSAIIGKNDIGKSTVLEAMDIFFNEGKGCVKIDKNDINVFEKERGNTTIVFTATFSDLPSKVIIDSSFETSLQNEYLLNADGDLEIQKEFPNAGKGNVYILAEHPTKKGCADLLTKKNNELKKAAVDNQCELSNKAINSVIRADIWRQSGPDLELKPVKIDASKEDAKKIWEKIICYLPSYSLFQSDRTNNDSDSEIQDPLKTCVERVLRGTEIQNQLNKIAETVLTELDAVATETLSTLERFDPTIASQLKPVLPNTSSLKWKDVFKSVGISGDDEIMINKRGSGVRRLVLLSFFVSQAEKKCEEDNNQGIIYALEEPETSQHREYRRLLAQALLKLSEQSNSQVVITTHSGTIVNELDLENVTIIRRENENSIVAEKPRPSVLAIRSMNEINYLAFGDATTEYHNELYSYIYGNKNLKKEFDDKQKKREYVRIRKNGEKVQEQKSLTEYIRNQIHHPENKENAPFTHEELIASINAMRDFLSNVKDNTEDC